MTVVRALFTSTPGWGHLHPMVPLARALLERGDDVLLATAHDMRGRLEHEGIPTAAAGLPGATAMAEFADRFPEFASLAPPDRPDFMFHRLFAEVRAAPMLADLGPVAREWRADVVVHDAAELAGPIVAAAAGVPSVCHSFGALLLPRRVAAASAVVEPLWREHGLEPRPYAGCYDHLYLDIYPPGLQPGERPHVTATQYLRPDTFATGGDEDLPEEVTATADPPLVYVTFGTMFADDAALSAVVRGVRQLDVRVLVTMGPHGDPAALGDQPANVRVTRYVAQQRLLPHCTAVVSHAGSGTFLAALSAGLPQLCLPQAADQFVNAEACARSATGLVIDPGPVPVDLVRDSVGRLLEDGSFREAAARLGDEIAAMPSPAEVADRLHAAYG